VFELEWMCVRVDYPELQKLSATLPLDADMSSALREVQLGLWQETAS